jgi:hypothetical protein
VWCGRGAAPAGGGCGRSPCRCCGWPASDRRGFTGGPRRRRLLVSQVSPACFHLFALFLFGFLVF